MKNVLLHHSLDHPTLEISEIILLRLWKHLGKNLERFEKDM